MTDEQLKGLGTLAEQATPGPWIVHPEHCQVYAPSADVFIGTDGPPSDPEAAFIAAANPTAVLALLERLEVVTRERDFLKGNRDRWLASDDCYYWTPEAQVERDRLRDALMDIRGYGRADKDTLEAEVAHVRAVAKAATEPAPVGSKPKENT